MKIRSSFLIIMIVVLPVLCQAQDLNSKILLTVGGRSIEAGEFIRMYRKSLDPEKPITVDEYLPQFILFKLKVADAISEGDDTTGSFRIELNGYRNQLAQTYLTDTLTHEKLLRSAYHRSLTEINAWHILIAMPQNPLPEDTIKAWKKATDIRERILRGEPFEQVARGSSDDKSAKTNGGNLGYFTVFQMIMPFEDAAYSLKKGAVSRPVRTPYGYHIIRVTDIRPSKGRIQVAHIMKHTPPGADEQEAKVAEDEINTIFQMLKAGAPFSEIAKKYSDHKESAAKGGVLNWFGTGEMIPEFAEAAFAISDTGDYSKPFRTFYGWHIVKLLKRKPPGRFEETSSYLESRINQSSLNSLSRRTFIDKLKKEYNYKINKTAFDWFVTNSDSLLIGGVRKYERSTLPEGNIYSFSDIALNNQEFADYVENRRSLAAIRDSTLFIKTLLEESASEKLMSYENSVLEKKYPDFRYLMNEFHDGILLFDISSIKVWDKVSNDTAGLHNYYEDNKYNYLSKKQIDARIYILKKMGGDKTLASAFKKYSGKPDLDKRISEKFNNNNDSLLIIKSGIWKKGDDAEIDTIDWIAGAQNITMNGFPAIILVKKVTEPLPLSFEEVQDKMMAGYQEFLENEWIRQLKDKYSVKIDNLMLDEVKKILINE